jgi:hypothetical protein
LSFDPRRTKKAAAANGVTCTDYKPEEVLQFFIKLQTYCFFTEVKPIDIGIWNLHLVHDFIYLLPDVTSVSELQQIVGGSSKTLYNKIKFASELRLIKWKPNGETIFLSILAKSM